LAFFFFYHLSNLNAYSLGREIDEKGNLVRQGGPVKTLAANVASGFAKKKIENPYLAHKSSSAATAVVEGATPAPVIPVSDILIYNLLI